VAFDSVVESVVEPIVAPTAELAVETPVEVASAGPVPAAAPAPVEAAPANQSGCRTDMARSVMTIDMPDIGYSCPVYAGGQSTIDAGAVTLITDQGSSPLLATHPGDTGTLWIAAHRTSHGGAFAAVPDLADGAIITVSDGSRTASYRIVGRAYVEARNGMVVDASGQPTDAATLDSVLRTDRGGDLAPRLILQTCDGPVFRWMVYADLVG
jgi:sortase (surface protein transpeptidase)